MSDSHDTSPHPTMIEAMLASVSGVRDEYAEWERVLSEQFERLEQYRAELQRQAELLEADRRRLEKRESQVDRERELAEQLIARLEDASLHAMPDQQGPDQQGPDPRDARMQQAAIEDLKAERAALEAELEMVRGRASELYETVHEQQRELTELRTLATSELGALRRWLERQSECSPSAAAEPAEHPVNHPALNPAERPVREDRGDVADPERQELSSAPAAHPSAPRVSPVPKAPAPVNKAQADPVLHSVMAQFARLQHDVAQRRQANR